VRIYSAIALASVLIASCTTNGAVLRSHQVKVPAEFASKAVSKARVSDAERYKLAYQEAWWNCVARFASDIDYQPSEFDRAGSGWPAAVWGYQDGYLAAELRIQLIRSKYGSERARLLLREATAKGQ
jgi:hypothetical protein